MTQIQRPVFNTHVPRVIHILHINRELGCGHISLLFFTGLVYDY